MIRLVQLLVVVACCDASYALGRRRGLLRGVAQVQAEAVWMLQHGALATRWRDEKTGSVL